MIQQISWAQVIAAYMPAAIIMVTVLLGVMSNNRGLDGVQRRLDDLRADMNRRFDSLEQRIDRLEERMEHPIVKGQ